MGLIDKLIQRAGTKETETDPPGLPLSDETADIASADAPAPEAELEWFEIDFLKPRAPRRAPVAEIRRPSQQKAALEPDPVAEALIARLASTVEQSRVATNVWDMQEPPAEDIDDLVHDWLVTLVDDPAKAAAVSAPGFPVGWLVIEAGPGLGQQFTLTAGRSSLGSAAGQSVRLDFGDAAIAPEGHVEIAYSVSDNSFAVTAGSGVGIVRRNGQPVVGTESLRGGDTLRLGATTLRFVALCDERFRWPDAALPGRAA
jgi:hypothetical protein